MEERVAIERLARIFVGRPVLAGDHLASGLAEAGLDPVSTQEDQHAAA